MSYLANDWLWREWREQAVVLVPRGAYLSGEINLHEILSGVPPALLAQMKRTLARHGRRFSISHTDDEGDEVHAILTGAREAVESIKVGAPDSSQTHGRPFSREDRAALFAFNDVDDMQAATHSRSTSGERAKARPTSVESAERFVSR